MRIFIFVTTLIELSFIKSSIGESEYGYGVPPKSTRLANLPGYDIKRRGYAAQGGLGSLGGKGGYGGKGEFGGFGGKGGFGGYGGGKGIPLHRIPVSHQTHIVGHKALSTPAEFMRAPAHPISGSLGGFGGHGYGSVTPATKVNIPPTHNPIFIPGLDKYSSYQGSVYETLGKYGLPIKGEIFIEDIPNGQMNGCKKNNGFEGSNGLVYR